MGDYNTQASIPQIATQGNRDLVFSRFFSISYGLSDDPDPLRRVDTIDALDVSFARAIRGTALLTRHDFYGEPLTTVAYQYHRTDSTWYLIVAYNGYLHPNDIPPGVSLRIPDVASFKVLFGNLQRSARKTFIF